MTIKTVLIFKVRKVPVNDTIRLKTKRHVIGVHTRDPRRSFFRGLIASDRVVGSLSRQGTKLSVQSGVRYSDLPCCPRQSLSRVRATTLPYTLGPTRSPKVTRPGRRGRKRKDHRRKDPAWGKRWENFARSLSHTRRADGQTYPKPCEAPR